MSMIGNLARVPDEVRTLLHAEPEKIFDLLYPDVEEEPDKKPGFFARLFGWKSRNPPKPKTVMKPLAESESMDIDKTWHALHFLFTGFAWEGGFPAGFLVSCGKPVGDVDVGYGPARSFTSAEVKKIAEFLTNLDRYALRGRLDAAQMEKLEIYWTSSGHSEEEWAYLEGGLDNAIAFVTEAAQKDLALLVYIN